MLTGKAANSVKGMDREKKEQGLKITREVINPCEYCLPVSQEGCPICRLRSRRGIAGRNYAASRMLYSWVKLVCNISLLRSKGEEIEGRRDTRLSLPFSFPPSFPSTLHPSPLHTNSKDSQQSASINSRQFVPMKITIPKSFAHCFLYQ